MTHALVYSEECECCHGVQQTWELEAERMELWFKDTADPRVSLGDLQKVPVLVSAKKCLNNDQKEMLIWAVLERTWPCWNSRGGFLGQRYPRDVIFIPKRLIKWAGWRRVEGHDYGGGLPSFPLEKAATWQISIKKGPRAKGVNFLTADLCDYATPTDHIHPDHLDSPHIKQPFH